MANHNTERISPDGRSGTTKPARISRKQGLLLLGFYILIQALTVFVIWVPANVFLNQVASDIGPANTNNQWRGVFIELVFFAEIGVPLLATILLLRYLAKRRSGRPNVPWLIRRLFKAPVIEGGFPPLTSLKDGSS